LTQGNTPMNITGSIRALLAAILLCIAVPTQQAAAQFWFGGGPARNPVLASKDLEEILDSAGLDDGQRQLAASMFDDAQLPMFAAKRRFDDEMERIGTANNDEKTTAAQQQARRALAQSIMESMDSFFQSLAAVARPEQQSDLQREHLAAKRRALRAIFGGALSDGAIQWDVERCIADAKLPPEERSAAYGALGDYRQRLDAIFPKLLEAVPDASRAIGRMEAVAGDDGVTRFQIGSNAASEAAAREFRELLQEIGAAHRDALQALEQALPADQLAALRLKCLGHLWRRTGMDPDSPARVIKQLLAAATEPEARAAIEAVRSTWMARWWVASMRMAAAESGMPRGLFAEFNTTAKDPAAAKAQAEFDEASEERRGIDRDTWKALIGVDPARREFYETQASDAANKSGNRFMSRALPKEGAQQDAVQMTSAVTVGAISFAESESDTPIDFSAIAEMTKGAQSVSISVTASADGETPGPVVIAMEGDGGMLFDGTFGDTFGDGMTSGIEFSQAGFTGDSMAGAGMSLALAATAERVRALAQTLGVAADHAALIPMIDDYQAKCNALKDQYGARLGTAVPGVAMTFDQSTSEAPLDQIRTGIGIVDAHAGQLALEDDALLDGLASLGGASEVVTQAVRAERARERIRSISYPTMPGLNWPASPIVRLDLAGCIQASAIVDPQRAAAMQAWVTWSPAALAVQEQLRAEARSTAAEEIELLRAMSAQWSGAQTLEVGVAVPTAAPAAEVPGQVRRSAELMAQRESRRQSLFDQAIAGRDAIEAALSPEARASFHDAWLRAAAPQAYRDGRDAMTTLDAARALPDVTDTQRSQIDALRGEQAARHRELCDRLAGIAVTELVGPSMASGNDRKAKKKEPRASMQDTRFERSELNARSLRRLKSILTDAQAREIPALAKTSSKQVQVNAPGANGANGANITNYGISTNGAGLSPAPTPPAPAPK
jgi:hypothetical protein